jgi:hypothetical protein
MECSECLAPYD